MLKKSVMPSFLIPQQMSDVLAMTEAASGSGQFLRIGHRGAAGHAPENTLASLERAIALGADLVEFDVRRSADGALVLLHDPTVDRTTNGKGKVEALPLRKLRSLDARNGERIPLLEEALACLSGRAGAMIEMKVPGIAAEVSRVVQISRFQGPVIFASFIHQELRVVRKVKNQSDILALFEKMPPNPGFLMNALQATHAGLALKIVSPGSVRRFQAMGIRVFVFTVDEPEDINRMRSLGVEGIISNFPDRL